MQKRLLKIQNELKNIPITSENELKLREMLHLLMTEIYLKKNKCSPREAKELKNLEIECLTALHELQNFLICECSQISLLRCRVDMLILEICCASDLLLSFKNCRVTLSLPDYPVETACCPTFIRDAVLNLISLAASENGCVHVNLRITRSQILISIKGRKPFLWKSVEDSMCRKQGSLYTAFHTMKLHGGKLWFQISKQSFKSVCVLPIIKGDYEKYSIPDFSEYVCDKLSPVRIGLVSVM